MHNPEQKYNLGPGRFEWRRKKEVGESHMTEPEKGEGRGVNREPLAKKSGYGVKPMGKQVDCASEGDMVRGQEREEDYERGKLGRDKTSTGT